MEVKINIQGDWILAQFIGMLDTPATEIIQPKIDEIIANASKNVKIDLAELSYIASAGIRQLLAIRKVTVEAGTEFVIENVQPAVYKVFKVTNLDRIFKLTNVSETY